jgi:hypothetical protein
MRGGTGLRAGRRDAVMGKGVREVGTSKAVSGVQGYRRIRQRGGPEGRGESGGGCKGR